MKSKSQKRFHSLDPSPLLCSPCLLSSDERHIALQNAFIKDCIPEHWNKKCVIVFHWQAGGILFSTTKYSPDEVPISPMEYNDAFKQHLMNMQHDLDGTLQNIYAMDYMQHLRSSERSLLDSSASVHGSSTPLEHDVTENVSVNNNDKHSDVILNKSIPKQSKNNKNSIDNKKRKVIPKQPIGKNISKSHSSLYGQRKNELLSEKEKNTDIVFGLFPTHDEESLTMAPKPFHYSSTKAKILKNGHSVDTQSTTKYRGTPSVSRTQQSNKITQQDKSPFSRIEKTTTSRSSIPSNRRILSTSKSPPNPQKLQSGIQQTKRDIVRHSELVPKTLKETASQSRTSLSSQLSKLSNISSQGSSVRQSPSRPIRQTIGRTEQLNKSKSSKSVPINQLQKKNIGLHNIRKDELLKHPKQNKLQTPIDMLTTELNLKESFDSSENESSSNNSNKLPSLQDNNGNLSDDFPLQTLKSIKRQSEYLAQEEHEEYDNTNQVNLPVICSKKYTDQVELDLLCEEINNEIEATRHEIEKEEEDVFIDEVKLITDTAVIQRLESKKMENIQRQLSSSLLFPAIQQSTLSSSDRQLSLTYATVYPGITNTTTEPDNSPIDDIDSESKIINYPKIISDDQSLSYQEKKPVNKDKNLSLKSKSSTGSNSPEKKASPIRTKSGSYSEAKKGTVNTDQLLQATVVQKSPRKSKRSSLISAELSSEKSSGGKKILDKNESTQLPLKETKKIIKSKVLPELKTSFELQPASKATVQPRRKTYSAESKGTAQLSTSDDALLPHLSEGEKKDQLSTPRKVKPSEKLKKEGTKKPNKLS